MVIDPIRFPMWNEGWIEIIITHTIHLCCCSVQKCANCVKFTVRVTVTRFQTTTHRVMGKFSLSTSNGKIKIVSAKQSIVMNGCGTNIFKPSLLHIFILCYQLI